MHRILIKIIYSLLGICLYTSGQGQDLSFELPNLSVNQGEIVEIPVTVDQFQQISSFQFTIRWDTEYLEFQELVYYNLENLSAMNFGAIGPAQGYLTCAWFSSGFSGVDVSDGTEIFVLRFALACETEGTTAVYFSNDPTEILATLDTGGPVPELFVPVVIDGGFTMNQPPLSIQQVILNHPSCYGGSNGCVDVEAFGGVLPYSFQWTNGATTSEVCDLTAGQYLCTITDGVGCSILSDVLILQNPDTLAFCGFEISNVGPCSGANACIDLNVCGMANPASFSWSNGATEEDPCDLEEGVYQCTVTDENGCTYVSPEIIVTNNGTEPISIMADITDAGCVTGGQIDLTVSGGVPPYDYQWSSGQMTEDIIGLDPGNYSCIIIDDEGCVFITNTFEVQVLPNTLELISTDVENEICLTGGIIDLSIQGGTSPYTFEWSNGLMTEDLSDLSAGVYSCTVTDAEGCQLFVESVTVDSTGSDLEVSVGDVSAVSCFGFNDGSIDLDINGTGQPFMFEWNNVSSIEDLSNLSAGFYNCTVTDDFGCTSQTASIEITEPDPIVLSDTTITNENGMSADGSILLDIEGGTPPYQHTWSNGADEAMINGLMAGEYYCTVTDQNGCTFEAGPFFVDQITGWHSVIKPELEIKIIPNPVINDIRLVSQSDLSKVFLLSSLGEKCIDINAMGNKELLLPIHSLSDGVYWLHGFSITGEHTVVSVLIQKN